MANCTETAVEAFRAFLEAAGPSAVYPPNVVKRTTFYPTSLSLDASVDTVWLLVPGAGEAESRQLDDNRCGVIADLDVRVIAAKRFEPATESPYESQPVRWQLANELAGDVLQPIFRDRTLGQAVWDTNNFRSDYTEDFPTWAVAIVHLTLRYRYAVGGR